MEAILHLGGLRGALSLDSNQKRDIDFGGRHLDGDLEVAKWLGRRLTCPEVRLCLP